MNRSRELAGLMLQKAREDAYVLARSIDDPAMPEWVLGFHAQQAVEKALKAVLCARDLQHPRTHDLSELLDLVRDAGIALPPDEDQLPELTPFGTQFRYEPFTSSDPDQKLDRVRVMSQVERTIQWCAEVL
ncbi:MAG: HEPN domain-containing protein, partial [SAR324 cluster bacterium]|nr:HEPN domain-containing protein [SAR324 cluster bacterium]